jgi:hypothetical protein
MNKQKHLFFACLTALLFPLAGYAEIYKHVDEEGRVTYSNVKLKGSKKLNLEPADTNFGTNTSSEAKPASNQVTPKDFPNVNAETQKNRDNSRKQILLSELASEKQALEEAKKAYEEGNANPEVARTPSGGIRRNYVKFQEKMEKLQANVDVHQRNIELLEKEISNIK